MKAHIFIATTQGLVAIQNITPIDDEDISSVVSVNGTSTTANISGSYHNFVKKGVGIIHQMFGACSYRVDVSARIDQGNSWQVAIYLAHLAQSKDILGNGEVGENDTVICATGEVNTSNLQVLGVNEVQVKYNLALPQLKMWTEQGAKALFILPEDNRDDLAESPYTLVVSQLAQAANALPQLNQNPQSSTNKKKLVSINTRHMYLAAATISIFLIVWAGSKIMFIDAPPQSRAEKTNLSNLAPKADIQLVAQLKQNKTCAKKASQSISLVDDTFTELSLNQVCELYLQGPQSISQLLLVAQDAYTVLPLMPKPQGWQIPLPKNRLSDRSYFLVTLEQSLNSEKIEQLRLYREAMSTPSSLTKPKLSAWLQAQNIAFTLFTHTLVVQ